MTKLTKSLQETTLKLNERIEKASDIMKSANVNLAQAWINYKMWHDYNKQLLEKMFSDDKICKEYAYVYNGPRIISMIQEQKTHDQEVQDFYQECKQKIDKLRNILNRMELFDEPEQNTGNKFNVYYSTFSNTGNIFNISQKQLETVVKAYFSKSEFSIDGKTYFFERIRELSIYTYINYKNHHEILKILNLNKTKNITSEYVPGVFLENFGVNVTTNYLENDEYLKKLDINKINNQLNKDSTMKEKILFLGSNPVGDGLDILRLDKESRDIQEGLRLAKQRDNFEFVQKFAVRPKDLARFILSENPHMLHFSGHGDTQGLFLENEEGEAKLVSTDSIAALFSLFKDSIKCVFLNSCYSESQAKEIAKYIPFVIGMNDAVPDDTAITFAISFYDAIGEGREIPFAFNYAIANISLEGLSGDDIPVLLQKKD
jgi:hypothetical protein